jgi:putative membrane-bound dehydrogenase-like protein
MRRFAISLLLVMSVSSASAQNDPMPPERTAALMQVPDGFKVTLFAGEPDVVKPIAMTLDDRGRLWVVESHSYPNWITNGKPGKDRILIFEDTKGTGHFDKRTIFLENGTNLSGIALGFGGVYLCATPNFIFIPIKQGEDKPAGPAEIVLDGWSLEAKHNVFNTLVWGPDGWLYGCNGILATSKIGKPGTPDDKRIPFNCGVWRWHPTKKVFEVFAWGTTNPWGLDFDERGELFITNCVIKHLFHIVQGGHYERMYGQDLNPHVYGLMQSCADHCHWAGGDWTTSRGGQGAHSDAGGGHAHAGCMIYQGDNWPNEYRGKVFMGNLHGNRINMDILERKGSGYVAHHGKDFLTCPDPWFRPLAIISGPDGGVYVSDWHDTGECHNYDKVHPSGRIYKITYGKPKKVEIDLAKLGGEELVKLQGHKNEWYARQARRLLQELAHEKELGEKVPARLMSSVESGKTIPEKLRAIWALQCIGGLDEKWVVNLLDHKCEDVRCWAVRLLIHHWKIPDVDFFDDTIAHVLRAESSPSVRLALASAIQRSTLQSSLWRGRMAWHLAEQSGNSQDANLPYMIWYALEAVGLGTINKEGDSWIGGILFHSKVPQVVQNLARLYTEEGKNIERMYDEVDYLMSTNFFGETQEERNDRVRPCLRGIREAYQGQSGLKGPDRWLATLRQLMQSKDAEIKESATLLAVQFGEPDAIKLLMNTTADSKMPRTTRENALRTLVQARVPKMVTLLHGLLKDQVLRSSAIQALATFDDKKTPTLLLNQYKTFTDAEKSTAIATLTSRPPYALALLDAIEAGKVPRADLSPFAARQLLNFKDKALTGKLTKVWGTLRPAQDKAVLKEKYFGIMAPEALKKADRSHGRLVFGQTCAKCHVLFGEGAKIGPDLTGSQRTHADYLLTKLLDPSATVAKDYQMTIIQTKSGRAVSGLVKEENDKIVAIQTENEVVRIAKTDIEAREQSGQSMMPEGQLEKLSAVEVRDLFAYLAGAGQVPLPVQKQAK